MSFIILENIRSAYNVGNVVRTADALGFSVVVSGYTPSPFTDLKVQKTSLGAEKNITIREIPVINDVIRELRGEGYIIIAAEKTGDPKEISLTDFSHNPKNKKFVEEGKVAIIFGNEVRGVEPDTLHLCDEVVYIPMLGVKESLNVGQATAIFMRELRREKE